MKRFVFLTFLVLVFGMPLLSDAVNLHFFHPDDSDNRIQLPIDGPYAFLKSDNRIQLLWVDDSGKITLSEEPSNKASETCIAVKTADEKYRFKVWLQAKSEPATRYPQPRRIYVVSDLEGDFGRFIVNLKAANIIDDSLHWNWRNNHLVILGDVFGKGADIVPIFWFIYRLEQEAEEMGGYVHFILGDQEFYALRGHLKRLHPKYHCLAETLEISYEDLWTRESILGAWLRTKNCMEVIGSDLYVHAGLSKAVGLSGLSFERINLEMKQLLGIQPEERVAQSNYAQLLFGSLGPLLYRGLALSEKCHMPMNSADLYFLLRDLGLFRIVMGHSECDAVTCRYNGQAIIVNTNRGRWKSSEQNIGLLITRDKSEIILIDGSRRPVVFNQ